MHIRETVYVHGDALERDKLFVRIFFYKCLTINLKILLDGFGYEVSKRYSVFGDW